MCGEQAHSSGQYRVGVSTTPANAASRTRLSVEVWLVLLLSLGASAIWSILALIEKATRGTDLADQTTSMNTAVTPDRPWLDLVYQLTSIGLALVPVGLVWFLLAHLDRPVGWSSVPAGIGLDAGRWARDLGWGAVLAAVIGLPGLVWYVASRAAGLNTTVAPANLDHTWWAIPVLVLAAAQNAVLEEVVMVGYLFTRLEQRGLRHWQIVALSALIRGCYHLYQGLGGGVGNVVMGLLFGAFYLRTRRVLPLVIAHTLLDVVAFVGYLLLSDRLAGLL